MMLQAQALGLGTTWVMAFNPTAAREVFKVPDNLEIVAMLPTGYPADDAPVNPLHTKYIELDEMVSYNEF